MQIVEIEISKLINYEKNARTHSKEQLQDLIDSIKKFGFNDPVEIDENNVIISGHARVLAANKAGLKTVPTVCHAHLNKFDKIAYTIASNKIAQKAEWDNTLLKENIVEICFTSPPYNLGKSKKKYSENDDNQQDYKKFLIDFTSIAINYCKVFIVNIQQLSNNKINLIEYLYFFRKNLIDTAIWNKKSVSPSMCSNVLNSSFEFLFFLSKDNMPSRVIPTANFRGTIFNVYDGCGIKKNDYIEIHQAAFPIHLPEWIINSFLDNKSGSVLDIFGGNGTTLIACEKSQRKCFMIELSPLYCDVIVRRWQKFTGKNAILESTGETFNEKKGTEPISSNN